LNCLRMSFLALGAVTLCNASLIHEYTFTNSLSDSAGNANGVAINGANSDGGFLSLNGQAQYIDFLEQIVPVSGDYTIVMDIRTTAVQRGYTELISQGYSMAPGFYLGTNPAGVFRVGDQFSDTGVLFPLNDGNWHQIVAQVNSAANTTILFVDGVQRFVGPAMATTTSGMFTRLGAQFYSYGEFFNGDIDNVRIFDNAVAPHSVSSAANNYPSGGNPFPTAGDDPNTDGAGTIANPEPATFVLIGLGAVALGIFRRSGKRNRHPVPQLDAPGGPSRA
jgi:hypothetical protein